MVGWDFLFIFGKNAIANYFKGYIEGDWIVLDILDNISGLSNEPYIYFILILYIYSFIKGNNDC